MPIRIIGAMTHTGVKRNMVRTPELFLKNRLVLLPALATTKTNNTTIVQSLLVLLPLVHLISKYTVINLHLGQVVEPSIAVHIGITTTVLENLIERTFHFERSHPRAC